MPLTVSHVLSATTPDNPAYEIQPQHWNSGHAATYAAAGSEISGAFSNLNGVSFGTEAGGRVTASYSSNHSHGNPTLNLTNLTGTTASASNGLTLSLSAAAPQTAISGVIASDATYTSGSVYFSNQNGVTVGSSVNGASQYVRLSVATSYAASNHSHGNPTLNLTNLSGTTASNSAGLTLSLSANAPGAATLTVSAVGNTTVNSSGTWANAVSMRAYGILSAGTSNGSLLLSTPDPVDFTYMSVGNSNLGNTAGDTGVFSQRVVFVGSNNITLSGSSNGGSATLSIIGGAGGGYSAGVSNVGNTSGNTGLTGSNLVLSGGNGVTLSQSTHANGGTVGISVATSYAASNHSHGNPTLNLTNLSGTTASASNGLTLSLSAAAPQTGISGLIVSDATYTSGTVSFSNQNGVTIGSSVNGASQYVRLSVATSYAASNHSHGNPTLALTNLTGTTASASDGFTLSLSAAAPGAANFSVGASNGGNTAGDTGVTGTRIVFAGGNNITVSQATDANGATLSMVGANTHAQQTGISGIIVSDATYTTGTVSFSGQNNITIGSSVNGASQYIRLSVGNYITTARASTDAIGLNTAQTNVTWTANSSGLSINAAGYAGTATALTGAIAATVNSGGVSVSVPATSSLVGTSGLSVSTNGSTISVYPAPNSYWDNMAEISAAGTAQGNSLVSVQPFNLEWPLAFSNVGIPISLSVASTNNNSTAYVDVSVSGVLYTRNASTLSSIGSFGHSLTQTWTSNATATIVGAPVLTATFAGTTLTPGRYWLALHVSTNNTATGGANTTARANTVSMMLAGSIGSVPNQIKLWGGQTADSVGLYSGLGIISTGATRASIAFSDIVQTGTRAQLAPVAVQFRNGTYQ
jgi:hypothetical protein